MRSVILSLSFKILHSNQVRILPSGSRFLLRELRYEPGCISLRSVLHQMNATTSNRTCFISRTMIKYLLMSFLTLLAGLSASGQDRFVEKGELVATFPI